MSILLLIIIYILIFYLISDKLLKIYLSSLRGYNMNRNFKNSFHMYTLKKRLLAMVLCIFILVMSLLSTGYISLEINHDCTGKDCPICSCIHQCESYLEQLMTGLTVLIAITVTLFLFTINLFKSPTLIATLVTQKVRLND